MKTFAQFTAMASPDDAGLESAALTEAFTGTGMKTTAIALAARFSSLDRLVQQDRTATKAEKGAFDGAFVPCGADRTYDGGTDEEVSAYWPPLS